MRARRKRAGVSDLRADLTDVGGYLDLVYADSAGFSVCGFGTPVLLEGRYKHAPFRQRSYRLPPQRQHLLDDVSAAVAGGEDVFITPLLRDAPTRAVHKSKPLPGRFVWLDVDDWSQDLERDLTEVGLPCHLVDSGGVGDRRHAYVDLGRFLPGLQVADYADRLSRALSTDTSGGNNKFLRPPGTFNHKGRLLHGLEPRPVRRLDTLNPLARADPAVLVEYLARRAPSKRTAPLSRQGGNKTVSHLLSVELPAAAPPCQAVRDFADAFRKSLPQDKRHLALLTPLLRLLRAGVNGHRGVLHVLPGLRSEFISAVHGSRLSDAVAGEEFDRAAQGSDLLTRIVERESKRGPDDLCACALEALKLVLVDPSRFSKRGRRTEHKVLQSLIREASRTKTRRVSKSQRQIAEDAECHQESAGKALHRLEANGLLEVVSRRKDQTTVLLVVPDLHQLMLLSSSSALLSPAGKEIDRLSRVRTGPTHPIFGSGGFRGGHEITFDALDEYRIPIGRGHLLRVKKGHGQLMPERRRTWRDVSDRSGTGGLTAAGLARRTGQTTDAIRRQLQQLTAKDLVVKVGGLWFRVAWHPEAVAQELAVADVPAKRQARHQQARVQSWQQRAELPQGHRLRIDRLVADDIVHYVHPVTGEVLGSAP